jgi:hypothetical protein
MSIRKIASVGSIVLGVLLVLGGVATWLLVSSTLKDQKITTADDACLAGRTVAGPFTAYCEAKVIEKHTLESTEGLTYAELDREDPRRETALTSSFLQSSLFTSVVALWRSGHGGRDGRAFRVDWARYVRCGETPAKLATAGVLRSSLLSVIFRGTIPQ